MRTPAKCLMRRALGHWWALLQPALTLVNDGTAVSEPPASSGNVAAEESSKGGLRSQSLVTRLLSCSTWAQMAARQTALNAMDTDAELVFPPGIICNCEWTSWGGGFQDSGCRIRGLCSPGIRETTQSGVARWVQRSGQHASVGTLAYWNMAFVRSVPSADGS